MIGDFKIIGKNCYIVVNTLGHITLEMLPKLKWYWKIYFAIKSALFGGLTIKEVRSKTK